MDRLSGGDVDKIGASKKFMELRPFFLTDVKIFETYRYESTKIYRYLLV